MDKVSGVGKKCEVYASGETVQIAKSRIVLCSNGYVYYTGELDEEIKVASTRDNLESGIEFVELDGHRFNPHHVKPEDIVLGGMWGDEWVEIFSVNTKLSHPKLPHTEIYSLEPEEIISIFNAAWQKAGLNRYLTELKSVFDFVEIQDHDLPTAEIS